MSIQHIKEKPLYVNEPVPCEEQKPTTEKDPSPPVESNRRAARTHSPAWTSLWQGTRRFSDNAHNTISDAELVEYIKGGLNTEETAQLRKQLSSSSCLQTRLKILSGQMSLYDR